MGRVFILVGRKTAVWPCTRFFLEGVAWRCVLSHKAMKESGQISALIERTIVALGFPPLHCSYGSMDVQRICESSCDSWYGGTLWGCAYRVRREDVRKDG